MRGQVRWRGLVGVDFFAAHSRGVMVNHEQLIMGGDVSTFGTRKDVDDVLNYPQGSRQH